MRFLGVAIGGLALACSGCVVHQPVPVAMQASPDTAKAARAKTGAKTSAKSKTTAKRASSKTSAKQKSDSILGRDSVIKFDPRDPRRQLPTIPPKKPPQQR